MKTYIKPVIEVINLRNTSGIATLTTSGDINGGGVNANSLNKVSATTGGTSLGQLK